MPTRPDRRRAHSETPTRHNDFLRRFTALAAGGFLSVAVLIGGDLIMRTTFYAHDRAMTAASTSLGRLEAAVEQPLRSIGYLTRELGRYKTALSDDPLNPLIRVLPGTGLEADPSEIATSLENVLSGASSASARTATIVADVDLLAARHAAYIETFAVVRAVASSGLQVIVFCLVTFIFLSVNIPAGRHLRDLSRRLAGALTRLRDTEARNRDVIDATNDFVWETDDRHRFTFVSERAAVHIGKSADDMVGRELFTALDIVQGTAGTFRRHLDRHLAIRDAIVQIRDDGDASRWLRVNAKALKDESGRFLGYRGAARDITSDMETQKAARENAEMRKHFVAIASHEMRTPLNAVVGFTHLLEQDLTVEAHRRKCSMIRTAAEGLLGIVNDILEVSRIDENKIDLAQVPFDLARIIKDATDLLTPEAERKGLRLACELAPCATWVKGDPNRLRQILLNLIGNAIKFTDSGSVTVDGSIVEIGRHVEILLHVTDTGIGMAPEQIKTCFDPFMRGQDGTTGRRPGFGLGLYITRRILDAMSGCIEASSIPGQGTTFTVALLLPATEPQVVTPRRADMRLKLSGAHILVAEDQHMARELIGEILKRAGATVTFAETGRDAAQIAAASPFDAVLMDVQMPVMDGREATRIIRGAPGPCRDIPIIGLSAAPSQTERSACSKSGMTDFLPKPVDPNAVIDMLAHWLSPEDSGAGGDGQPPLIDEETVSKLFHHLGRETAKRIYENLVPSVSADISSLFDAETPLPGAEIARIAHRIKGTSGSYGLLRLSHMAKALEEERILLPSCRRSDLMEALEDACRLIDRRFP